MMRQLPSKALATEIGPCGPPSTFLRTQWHPKYICRLRNAQHSRVKSKPVSPRVRCYVLWAPQGTLDVVEDARRGSGQLGLAGGGAAGAGYYFADDGG